MTLRTLNYGNYGIFLIMGNAGFCPLAVVYALRAPFMGTIRVQKGFRASGSMCPNGIFLRVSFKGTTRVLSGFFWV